MSSSFSTHLVSLLQTLLDAVTSGELLIVSSEYTVMREKGQRSLLSVELVLCEEKQKEKNSLTKGLCDVEPHEFML